MIHAVHIPVELCGGPYCGLQGEVERVGGTPEVYLLDLPGNEVWAYQWADRSNSEGRWILTAVRCVGRKGAPSETTNTKPGKEAADGL
jgi:hypothetical protein